MKIVALVFSLLFLLAANVFGQHPDLLRMKDVIAAEVYVSNTRRLKIVLYRLCQSDPSAPAPLYSGQNFASYIYHRECGLSYGEVPMDLIISPFGQEQEIITYPASNLPGSSEKCIEKFVYWAQWSQSVHCNPYVDSEPYLLHANGFMHCDWEFRLPVFTVNNLDAINDVSVYPEFIFKNVSSKFNPATNTFQLNDVCCDDNNDGDCDEEDPYYWVIADEVNPYDLTPPVIRVCKGSSFTYDPQNENSAIMGAFPQATTEVEYELFSIGTFKQEVQGQGYSHSDPLGPVGDIVQTDPSNDINFLENGKFRIETTANSNITPENPFETIIGMNVKTYEVHGSVRLLRSINKRIFYIVVYAQCGSGNCPAALPSPDISGINNSLNPKIFSKDVEPGKEVSFNIFGLEAFEGQDVSLSWNNGIPGASFTVDGSTGTFTWTPPLSEVGTTKTFTVTAVANTCSGSSAPVTKTFTLNVLTPKCAECITSFSPPPGEYIISAWVKEEHAAEPLQYTSSVAVLMNNESTDLTATTPPAPKGPIIDGWQRIEGKFTIPANTDNITIRLKNLSSPTVPVYFDDIRIHPVNGTMKSYVYDPVSLKLAAELDENNYATFYEYDQEGKLLRIKKETERGIMTIQESRNNTFKRNP